VSEQEAAEKAAARETAAANVEASRANVRRLEELVSFQRVVAPFAGTVTIRAVDVGDLIVAGAVASNYSICASGQTPCLRPRAANERIRHRARAGCEPYNS